MDYKFEKYVKPEKGGGGYKGLHVGLGGISFAGKVYWTMATKGEYLQLEYDKENRVIKITVFKEQVNTTLFKLGWLVNAKIRDVMPQGRYLLELEKDNEFYFKQ